MTRYFIGESRPIPGQNKCGTKHHGTFLVALKRAISLVKNVNPVTPVSSFRKKDLEANEVKSRIK